MPGAKTYRIGVPVFPGTNCDRDVMQVLTRKLGPYYSKNLGEDVRVEAEYIWHEGRIGKKYDAYVIPGGFTYGDRLRAGAIAAHAEVMKDIKSEARDGKPVLGICNGFQILVEAGLLPGALTRNKSLRFECKWVEMRVEGMRTPFTYGIENGALVRFAVANGEGNYYNYPEAVEEMRKKGQLIFMYTDDNVSGSPYKIAGVANGEGNVVGLMPHPDRASDVELGGDDGMKVFASLVMYLQENT